MSTFKQLQDDVLNYFGGQDAEIKDEIKRAINETMWDINAEVPRSIHLEKTETFTTTVGTTTVTDGLPSNFDHILSISILVDSEMTLDADTCILTDHYPRWERVITKGAISKIHDYLGFDDQLIQKAEAEYQLVLKRFRAWTNRNLDKSPNSTRVRGWKEKRFQTNPLVPSQFRRD